METGLDYEAVTVVLLKINDRFKRLNVTVPEVTYGEEGHLIYDINFRELSRKVK